MKRALKLPFVVVAIIGLFGVAGTEAEDNQVHKQELERLQGTWVLVSGEVEGKKVDSKSIKASRMTYSGDTVTLTTPHQSKQPIKARLKRLDPKKAPSEMDWVRGAGPGAGRTMQAIYEFQGEDTYKVCFHPTGNGRPKEFATTTGGCRILHVWKRAKK
jgi:uncharacterized protein (TIGR03067 family)